MRLEFSRQILEKGSNIKFHRNASSGSRVVSCGRTDGHTTLIVAFRNFANVPNKPLLKLIVVLKFCNNPFIHIKGRLYTDGKTQARA